MKKPTMMLRRRNLQQPLPPQLVSSSKHHGRGRSIGYLICVLLILGVTLYSQQFIVYDLDYHRITSSYTLLESIISSPYKQNSIQLDQYFDSMVVLNNKIQDNIDFHQRGGNLKLYQEFLDNAIDSTYQKYDTHFVPKPDLPNGGTNVSKVTGYLQQYYVNHTTPRRGYGEPLPGTFTNADKSKLLYERRWIDIVEPRRRKMKWDVALGPIGPKCSNLIQLGAANDTGDGGKSMCVRKTDKQIATTSTGDKHEECHVISIGGNDNWVFETAMVDTIKNCTTYTFDCTLPDGIPKNKPNTDQMKFFNYCIFGGTSISSSASSSDDANAINDRKYITYQEASLIAGITVAPMYFKMDVEGFEYDIFTNMLQTTPYELLPIQIQVELHWNTRMTDLSWMLRTRTAGEILLLTNMMFSIGGYIPIEYDFNPSCASCMEVLYFRAALPATTSI